TTRPAAASSFLPYTTLFRSGPLDHCEDRRHQLLGPVPRGFEPRAAGLMQVAGEVDGEFLDQGLEDRGGEARELLVEGGLSPDLRSEEHTSELQSRFDIVCRH